MKKNEKSLSIEEGFKELDKIIDNMDDDKCSIEKSLELYEKGVLILNDLKKKVDKVEKEIKVLEEK